MRRIWIGFLALVGLFACGKRSGTAIEQPPTSAAPEPPAVTAPAPTAEPVVTADPAAALAGKTFVRENGGFGGDFTITLGEDGTFTYYEGFLSSYIGFGAWSLSDGVLILCENRDYGFVFRFAVTDGSLCYLAEGSDRFLYVDVADGERFLPDD